MGGRGARSGMSKYGNPYGSQYHSLLTAGNIKFVEKNSRDSETLMETMTPGRVYVQVGGGELKSIVFFDENNMRAKQIDLDHPHAGISPHRHDGYFHDTFKGALEQRERDLVDKVREIWENRKK